MEKGWKDRGSGGGKQGMSKAEGYFRGHVETYCSGSFLKYIHMTEI